MIVKTRFAPSPTGLLHIGGIRTALFNYLFAKKNNGKFILRLEDTDRERFVPEGVQQIVDGLSWVGLRPDDGFWINDGQQQNKGFVQSQRHQDGFYQKWAAELLSKGLAYYSPTSQEQLTKLRRQATAQKKPFLYRKELDSQNNATTSQAPIRLDIVAAKAKIGDTITWLDEVRGQFTEQLDLVEDFIIIKSDGYPTYNLANVIDDQDMGISHVIRGDEFIASTAKHALLYDLFGWQRPVFVHLPVINGSDGKKLSKRTGDTNVLEYKDKGYLPEALLNFLALLGWNDSTEQEFFDRKEMISAFSLQGINTSPAIFDQKRLDWLNGHYIRNMSLDNLLVYSHDFWPDEAAKVDSSYKLKVLALVQERLKYLAELPELTRFFFTDLPIDATLINQHKQLSKMSRSSLKILLQQSRQALAACSFSTKSITDVLNDLLKSTGQSPSVIFSLIRIATTQAPFSPGIAETLAVIGKSRSLARLDNQIKSLSLPL